MLKKFKYNDIQQCHFLNNKNNIKLYCTYKKNKYFINPFTAAVLYIVPTKCGPILRVYYI